MSRRVGALAILVLVGLVGACSEHRFEPPDRSAQIAEADSLFRTSLFDTVTWAADSVRALQGNVVYSTYCRNCHGPLGRGRQRPRRYLHDPAGEPGLQRQVRLHL